MPSLVGRREERAITSRRVAAARATLPQVDARKLGNQEASCVGQTKSAEAEYARVETATTPLLTWSAKS